MRKKVVSLMLVGAMAATLFAGCGSAGDAGTNTANGTESGAKVEVTDNLEEKQEMSIWLYKDDYRIYDNYAENPVVQYLEEKFNCELTFQQPAMGSEFEQFSLMLGTGSYTDIMEISYSQQGVSSLYADGVITDLAPYIESCMPNFYAFMNAPENEDVKKALYDSQGHLFTIPMQLATQEENRWGGLVYRKDILDLMTGGYVSFPSGNEEPTTVADWEYMLELYSQYFAASGMPDYACLILPAEGYFVSGELLTGFGTAANFFVDDSGKVAFGPTQEGFYNYLTTMRDWYAKGYIYKDFASRTNDVFYLPNTALTYGAAAGIWFGLNAQLDDAMSMPEYNLFVDVQPVGSPLAEGIDARLPWTSLENGRVNMNQQGYVVSSSCDEAKLVRFLSLCDYLFSEEGSMLRSYGLTAEQGSADNKYYVEADIADGAYTMTNGEFQYAEAMVPNVGKISTDQMVMSFNGGRLPGLLNNEYELAYCSDTVKNASVIWKGTGKSSDYPSAISFDVEDNDITTSNYSAYIDYINSMVPKFIMGTEELTPETFAAFVEQVNSLGAAENLEIYQRYYDAYVQ